MIGKRILITGATSGIGLLLTEKLLQRGAHVTATGRNIENLNALKHAFPILSVMQVDMLDELHIKHLLDWIDASTPFDYLINCAGFAEYDALTNQNDAVISEMIQVNFMQTTLITKHVAHKMNAGGMIVTLGSASAKVTTPYGAIYAATKSAINQVMHALRLEMPHIHFLVVNTGPVNTAFIHKANKGKAAANMVEKVLLDADDVAEKIIQTMLHRKSELNLPIWMNAGLTLYNLAPRTIEKHFKKLFMSKKK